MTENLPATYWNVAFDANQVVGMMEEVVVAKAVSSEYKRAKAWGNLKAVTQ